VVDWAIGQNDFPAGMVCSREKDAQPGDLLQVTGQLSKMINRIAIIYHKRLQEMTAALERAREVIAEKDRTISELQGGGPNE